MKCNSRVANKLQLARSPSPHFQLAAPEPNWPSHHRLSLNTHALSLSFFLNEMNSNSFILLPMIVSIFAKRCAHVSALFHAVIISLFLFCVPCWFMSLPPSPKCVHLFVYLLLSDPAGVKTLNRACVRDKSWKKCSGFLQTIFMSEWTKTGSGRSVIIDVFSTDVLICLAPFTKGGCLVTSRLRPKGLRHGVFSD